MVLKLQTLSSRAWSNMDHGPHARPGLRLNRHRMVSQNCDLFHCALKPH